MEQILESRINILNDEELNSIFASEIMKFKTNRRPKPNYVYVYFNPHTAKWIRRKHKTMRKKLYFI